MGWAGHCLVNDLCSGADHQKRINSPQVPLHLLEPSLDVIYLAFNSLHISIGFTKLFKLIL